MHFQRKYFATYISILFDLVAFSEETMAKLKTKHESDKRELALCWKLLPKILENASAVSHLHDCAMFEYTVRDILHPGDWENQENMVSFLELF